MKVLLSRRETVKLLILAELMRNPECNQRDIAKKLSITPQAVSEHFKELVSEELINVVHKGYYVVTEKGKDWLNRNLFDLHMFTEDLISKIYSSSVLALAREGIKEGDTVEYWFEDGFVYVRKSETGNGVATGDAEEGEEVLVKPTGAFTPPQKGEVVIFKVPMVERGGSRAADVEHLEKLIKGKRRHVVVAMGLEALVTCRKAGVEPIFFGAKNVCIEASHHGSGVIAVVTESVMEDLVRTLIEEGISFDIVDGSKQKD
ncbi:winged helix-turn-helix transcriptional regulator [Geoglobus acetivorans]|uniref:Winged helix-turn-helix transcriptional regulator n=1 Tax=Geoglobus acetivorans TaxID=565033 RepID=A0ABZ3H4E5_GEOAI|nr:winged helix-turn-helix transcriptional regulator [Geoglobus acetivorans]